MHPVDFSWCGTFHGIGIPNASGRDESQQQSTKKYKNGNNKTRVFVTMPTEHLNLPLTHMFTHPDSLKKITRTLYTHSTRHTVCTHWKLTQIHFHRPASPFHALDMMRLVMVGMVGLVMFMTVTLLVELATGLGLNH